MKPKSLKERLARVKAQNNETEHEGEQDATLSRKNMRLVARDRQPSSGVGNRPAAISPADQRELMTRGLQNTMVKLASMPEFYGTGIGSDRALENPISWFNRRLDPSKSDSEYAISGNQLSKMIGALMVAGSQKANKRTPSKVQGTELDRWLGKSAVKPDLFFEKFEEAMKGGTWDQLTTRALDTTFSGTPSVGGGVLVRTDLEQLLRVAYLRQFPFAEYIENMPANGVVHSYNLVTDPGDAVFLGELGDLTAAGADSQGSYQRQYNNVAIIASRRGVSLKLQYATSQSGMQYELSGQNNIEVKNAITAIARADQGAAFQGNYDVAAKTLNDEEGLYNQYSYNGLRKILQPYAITKSPSQTYLDVTDQAVAEMMNAGADLEDIQIWTSVGGKRALNKELLSFYRVTNESPAGGIDNDLSANGIMTVSDYKAKVRAVPANRQQDGLGYYNLSTVATEDMYVTDPTQLAFAYLGSPNPTVLELPIGYNGVLSNVYIIFMMHGLVVYNPNFNRKIRIGKQTV